MSWVALGVAAVGAAGTAYSASQAGEGAPAQVQANPGKSLLQYLKGLDRGLPQLQQMEATYRPQFGQLNIADQQQYLNALLGMGGQAGTEAQGQLQQQRAAEYQNMIGNTGAVMGLLGGIDPNSQMLTQRASQMAGQRFDAAQGLNFQEQRGATQTAREAFASRGRLNDTSSVAAEVLGREEVLQNKRAEAMGMGQQAMGMSQAFTSPALGILMGAPASTALGQDYVSRSMGIIGQNQPQFINPDAGINMGQQNAANMNAYMQAQSAAKQNSAAMYGKMGSSLIDLAGTIYKG